MSFFSGKVLRGLSRFPLIGKRYQKKLDQLTVDRLASIREGFNKQGFTFQGQVHALYDCLQGFQVPSEMNPRDYLGIPITANIKSSSDGVEMLDVLLRGVHFSHYFYFNPSPQVAYRSFLDWCTNVESLQAFITDGTKLLAVYCLYFPIPGTAQEQIDEQPELSESTETFLGSVWLRYLVFDLIEVVTLLLRQRLGETDGKRTA